MTHEFRRAYDAWDLVPAGLAARPRRGYFFCAMPADPDIKRAVSFIDGQNLYRHAKDAFGHHHPNYDPSKLADAVCADHGWVNAGVLEGEAAGTEGVGDDLRRGQTMALRWGTDWPPVSVASSSSTSSTDMTSAYF